MALPWRSPPHGRRRNPSPWPEASLGTGVGSHTNWLCDLRTAPCPLRPPSCFCVPCGAGLNSNGNMASVKRPPPEPLPVFQCFKCFKRRLFGGATKQREVLGSEIWVQGHPSGCRTVSEPRLPHLGNGKDSRRRWLGGKPIPGDVASPPSACPHCRAPRAWLSLRPPPQKPLHPACWLEEGICIFMCPWEGT